MEPRPDWWDRAACRGIDPDVFFPTAGEPVAPAKAICATCPVRTHCRDHALDHHEDHGIWGGLDARQRRRILRDRRRAA